MQTRLEITESAVPIAVRRIRHQVSDAARDAGVSAPVANELELCVGEAVANVVQHAYGSEEGSVDVLLDADDEEVSVTVRDHGIGFPVSRSSRGNGLGLRIIRELARDLSVSSRPRSGTELRMTFPVESPAHVGT